MALVKGMAEVLQSESLIHREPLRKGLQSGQLSLEEMKRMLRNAEGRLSGSVSLQANTQIHDAQIVEALPYSLPKLQNTLLAEPYLTVRSRVARLNPTRTVDGNERHLADQSKLIADGARSKKAIDKGPASDAGADWFHLPRTKLTPELKRDLQLLKVRSTWDPKRHYKKDTQKPFIPQYSQVGTILEGPTEYYSSRIPKRDRKRSFVEDILATEEGTSRFKNRYNEIQASKKSGRRAYYNQLKQKRAKSSLGR
ncbi:MAG: hypothetical protein LQ338_002674 [Usnochroma carphineum]|nr:MAG: hypothetical protein LQ338_002674 [Usnochroma carphineum]